MSRVQRKTAVPLSELIRDYLKAEHLTTPLNTQRIFAAWDAASGAGSYTVRRFFREGRLYITVNSSVVRSQLSFQRDALLRRINTLLEEDELFTRDDARTGFVRELILK
jgi:hypothetical protein